MAYRNPYVCWPLERILFGVHDWSSCVTVRGTHKEDPPLGRNNQQSSLLYFYLQPTVHCPVHRHKGTFRYVCPGVVRVFSNYYSFLIIIKYNETEHFLLTAFVSSGQRLKFIEEEVLKHLTEQIQLRSESIISDLEKAAEKLKNEPADLYDLSVYSLLVWTASEPT